MIRLRFLLPAALLLSSVAIRAEEPVKAAASAVKPLNVLLITGGCGDYLKPYDPAKFKPAEPNAGPQPTPAKPASPIGGE